MKKTDNNGNINWDDDYSSFCDFISERLCEQPDRLRKLRKPNESL